MRHRNSPIGRSRIAGRHAGNHFKFNPRFVKLPSFLSASSEDEGISPFQPGNVLSLQRLLNQQPVCLLLSEMMMRGPLSRVNKLRIFPGLIEGAVCPQIVIDNHVCPADTVQAFPGEKA